jgi:hypothetical protein
LRFDNRRASRIERFDKRGVEINADDVVALRRENCGQRRSKFSEPNDRNSHISPVVQNYQLPMAARVGYPWKRVEAARRALDELVL